MSGCRCGASNVPQAGLEQLLPYMEQITFKKGSLAVSSEISDDAPIYFLVSGRVRFSYCDATGGIMPLGARIISKDEIFGHDAIAVGGTVRCSAVCESKAVCLTITPQSLEMVLRDQQVTHHSQRE